MKSYHTQVAIIGSGPAGLLLSRLLCQAGIESIIIEKQTMDYVRQRIRAGVLEHGSVEILCNAGVGARLKKEGLVHEGFEMGFEGDFFRIDLKALTGKEVTVYGQTEITKDLMEARMQDNPEQTFYSAENVRLTDLKEKKSLVVFEKEGTTYNITCNFIAGCDGFHGVSRPSIPQNKLKTYLKSYNFGWLGLLSDTKPISEELIYAYSSKGFSLCSMRSNTRSRYYLQCPIEEDVNKWTDEMFWEELRRRLGEERTKNLETGSSLEKSIAPLKSFACEPISYGNLYLAGDSAHIVPPTGAKGLNLAICDVKILAEAIISFFHFNNKKKLEGYSNQCLTRVWKVERFSWTMSYLLHQFQEHTEFEKKIQKAEFSYLKSSEAARKSLAENYVGLPVEVESS